MAALALVMLACGEEPGTFTVHGPEQPDPPPRSRGSRANAGAPSTAGGTTAETGGAGAGASGASGSGARVDPCREDNGGCDPLTTCTSDSGEVSCGACPTGYDDVNGDASECQDIDECAADVDGCDASPDAACTNTMGSFACTCPDGYDGTGVGADGCTDIDECMAQTDNCDSKPDACTNTLGSFVCTCPSGYGGTGMFSNGCTDVDECLTDNGGCDTSPMATCENAPGTSTCMCPDGYDGTGVGEDGCADVDECAADMDGCDDSPDACTNTPGSSTCACPDGYAGAGVGADGCTDVDECSADTDDCDDSPDACANTTGSFTCTCPGGYSGAGVGADGCADVDECLTDNGGCDTGPMATCTNLPGSSACTCPRGYGGTGIGADGCVDTDECTAGTHQCSVAECMNEPGGYRCGACPMGYDDVNGDGSDCQDIDECLASNTRCDDVPDACVNTPGSFTCACPSGYGGTAVGPDGCADVDECTADVDGCDDSPDVCVNTTGSFTCACPAGYSGTGMGADGCADVDECLTNHGACDTLTTCFNTEGSHACGDCPLGYSGNGAAECVPALTALTVSEGVLRPAFSPEQTTYTVSVPLHTSSIQLTPSAVEGVTIKVNDTPVTSGTPSAPIALSGPTDITVTVEAPGRTPQVYVVTVLFIMQEAYVKASDTEEGDTFFSVALDGDTLAVGAYQEDEGSMDSGAVYVFTRTDGVWSQQARLKASTVNRPGHFGYSVALSGDTLAVGAWGETSNNYASSGAAYVFTRADGVWTQRARLQASNPGYQDHFGWSLALSGDTLAVGAHGESSPSTGVDGDQTNYGADDSGAVYVFTRTGGAWSQRTYLKAGNAAAGDKFGYSVALSGDTLVAGANAESSAAFRSGAAYVFTRTAGVWSQQAYLKASNPGLNDDFGASVALSGDTLVAGALGERSSARGVNGDQNDDTAERSGAAYVFTRTAGVWTQQAYVKASNSERFDFFGSSVALSGDTLAVGASGEDGSATGVGGDQSDNSAGGAGAVYVFTRSNSVWSQEAYVKASNPEMYDSFGLRVAVSGGTFAVGAAGEDSSATGVGGDQADNGADASGAVYVFR